MGISGEHPGARRPVVHSAPMMLSPTIEDYLQVIEALLSEGQPVIGARLAERLKVTPASVSQTLDRMQRQHLVTVGENHRLDLTPEGRQAADSIVRRHRLVERFLTDILGLDWVQAHEEAHRIEHAVSEIVEARLDQLLHHPQTCPHGAPIPGNFPIGGDRGWIPVGGLGPGRDACITRISDAIEDDTELLLYCDEKNLRPGVRVRMTEEGPGGVVVLSVNGAAVALSEPLTRHILCLPMSAGA